MTLAIFAATCSMSEPASNEPVSGDGAVIISGDIEVHDVIRLSEVNSYATPSPPDRAERSFQIWNGTARQ